MKINIYIYIILAYMVFAHHLTMADLEAYFPFFVTCLISTLFLLWAFLKSTCAKSLHILPTPFALPIIGHLHLLLLSPTPHQAFHKLSSRYGPVFRLFLGSQLGIVVSSPEMAKEFLKTQERVCLDKAPTSAAGYITYGSKDFVFAPYGPYWTFMKKIVMSNLLNGKTLDMLSSVRHEEINGFINSISKKAKVGEAMDLEKELMKLTNNVISRMLMGKRCTDHKEESADDMMNLVADMILAAGSFNIPDYIWLFKGLDLQGLGKKVKKLRARFDVMIERIIKEHEEARKHGGEMKDLLDILLHIEQDESMEIKLSRENIKAFFVDLFLAATDTTASTMKWGLSQLINHPNIMKKALEEINQVVGENRLLQESDIPNLPYLQAIVKETLRLHPGLPVLTRQSTEDFMVAGYHIPAKSLIFINLWALGRDPSHWESPHEFRPERFLEKENGLDVRGQHFHILPFGSGRRMCPGLSLAQIMVHATLGAMIQCFDWKAGKDGNLPSVDMKEGSGPTLTRANPLVCVPVARIDPIPISM